jgi:hypothetical protein
MSPLDETADGPTGRAVVGQPELLKNGLDGAADAGNWVSPP